MVLREQQALPAQFGVEDEPPFPAPSGGRQAPQGAAPAQVGLLVEGQIPEGEFPAGPVREYQAL